LGPRHLRSPSGNPSTQVINVSHDTAPTFTWQLAQL